MEAAYTFPHSLKRTNGRFADADLARILQNATAAPAGAFGARGTPEVLRVVELLSIEQGRAWGVCTVRIFVSRFVGFLFPPASVKRVPRVHGVESYVPSVSVRFPKSC
jgi:hypothetical protein